jgi:hypothetical protein
MAHYFASDATLEALAVLLAGSPGVAMFRDELVSWVKACDAYRGGRGGDRQQWLSLWAGAPLKIDRKTADSIYVPRPTVCVTGGVQPDLLVELADEAGRRDGFVERILWSYPDTGHVEWSEAQLSNDTRKGLIAVFEQLRRAPLPDPKAIDDHPTVRLGQQAKERFVAWFNDNARATHKATGLVQGVYAKLPNQLARIALVLHALKNPEHVADKRVTGRTMEGAIELAEYFRAHAQRVLPALSVNAAPRSLRLASPLLGLMQDADGAWVSRTDLHRGLNRHVAADDLDEALAVLEARALAERQSVSTGGRSAEMWRARDGLD